MTTGRGQGSRGRSPGAADQAASSPVSAKRPRDEAASPGDGGPAARRPLRRRVAKAVLVLAVLVQATLLIRGEFDPHKLFGFRPFNESDAWQAEIVRVHADGSRHPVGDGTWQYEWNELVGTNKLRNVDRLRHAAAGAPASVDFLDRALDWAVDNIPDDPDTVALEATVTVFHNRRGPEATTLRSEREPVP